MRFLNLSLCLFTAAALLVPITANAKTSHMMSVQTPSGKTVQLRTMKVHGQMMMWCRWTWRATCFTSIATDRRRVEWTPKTTKGRRGDRLGGFALSA
jgi:hypothetical protein